MLFYLKQSILNLEFAPTFVEVKDVSGGCGAMFNITVESTKFKVSWHLTHMKSYLFILSASNKILIRFSSFVLHVGNIVGESA